MHVKHYEKPSLSLALFSSREAIASDPYNNPYRQVGVETTKEGTPVTVYEIYSLSSAS